MATIGNITVPSVATSGVFPLASDYGYGKAISPEIAVHQFGSANAKIEQRFWLGDGLTRYTVVRSSLTQAEFESLRNFWEARKGPYQPFTYAVPSDDGQSTSNVTVRFENAPLTFEHMSDALCSVGLTFVEVPDPDEAPSYTLNSTDTRFPSASLKTALLDQVQTVVPLLKITVKESGYAVIYLSDRRCTVGAQLYQARLLRFDGISQSMNGEADDATFVFGNADDVMRDLAEDTNLWRAKMELSLFHVGSGIKLDLWTGEVVSFSGSEGPEFTVQCSDSIYELTLDYPVRTIERSCWKDFDDGVNCPYTSVVGGVETDCDKSWTQCQARSMDAYFGGVVARPQSVRIKDNSSGLWGIGRRAISSVSLVSDSIYGQPLQEIYTDTDMPVNCQLAAGREESEFYSALGIVGQGPISGYATDGTKHRLDGQPAHGPLPYGLRRSYGHDPVQNSDPDADSDEFSISAVGGGFTGDRAAGVAFVEIRRTDPEGLQLSRITEHQIQAWVSSGLGGWKWTSGTRSWQSGLTNPVWIAVNAVLKAKGIFAAVAATQETVFDVDSAEAAAAICATSVPVIIGSGSETQFVFRGVISDRRPLRDWLQEILNSCLGYYVQSNGKLKIGIRSNSSAVEAFTAGNIILDSLQLASIRPGFNHISGNYGDADFEWKPNTISIGDIDHAKFVGTATGPQWLKSQMNLVGVAGMSQAARIVTTRLREEIGGISAAEWKAARQVAFGTTILALAVEPGMVCSLTDDEMPGGAGEFRVLRWRLNPDYSIVIEGRSTTDSMYDLTVGPKPADVTPSPVPDERIIDVIPVQPWFPYLEQPDSADPFFAQTDWQFGLSQTFEEMADGSQLSKLVVSGRYPDTAMLAVNGSVIGSYSIADAGGTIAAGEHVTIALTAVNSDGHQTLLSQPVNIAVGTSGNENKITLGDIGWPAGTIGYRLYASADHRLLSVQDEDSTQPSSIDLTALSNVRTTTVPHPTLKEMVARVRYSFHAGVDGLAITGVSTDTLVCAGAGWTPGEWIGRIITIISDESDGSAPVWNFLISANTTESFTVSPDPESMGVEIGDALIIRTEATSYSSTTIGDAKFENASYPAGMTVNEETGRMARIVHGTGSGQRRRIASNTSTVLTIDEPWETTPDDTSVFVVESVNALYSSVVQKLADSSGGNVFISIPVDNFLLTTLVCEVAMIDKSGRESAEAFNPWREIYLFGEPGNVGSQMIQIAYS